MNVTLLKACLWSMCPDLHTAHVQCVCDHDDERAYNSIVWLKCVWERNRESQLYLPVLQGRAPLASIRADIARQQPFLQRLVKAYQEQTPAKQSHQQQPL